MPVPQSGVGGIRRDATHTDELASCSLRPRDLVEWPVWDEKEEVEEEEKEEEEEEEKEEDEDDSWTGPWQWSVQWSQADWRPG